MFNHIMLNRLVFSGFLIVIAIIFAGPLFALDLPEKQRSLAERYAQLEQILFRLAETSSRTNPRQADLLRKVLFESKDKLLVHRLETLTQTLERRQLADAVAAQSDIEQDLILLLRLLERVSRDENRDREKEALQEFLKDVEDILHGERTLVLQTQQYHEENLPDLHFTQRDLRMQMQSLEERVAADENNIRQTPDGLKLPGRHAIEQTLLRMQAAELKLQQAQRNEAIEEQEEAISQLQRLREELEKILRQLREEELMQTLEKLETRFKRMIQQETSIRTQSARLMEEIAESFDVRSDRPSQIRSGQLAAEQQSVLDEAETTLLILREDGTAQAMVESLLQARFDMNEVKKRLEQTKLDALTLRIADSIIESLQEMLDSVQSAIADTQQRQSGDDQPPRQGETAQEPLIQLLAELRMIHSMQRRVHERTARYNVQIQQALDQPGVDLRPFQQAVEELARQQNRISRILHELQIGMSQ